MAWCPNLFIFSEGLNLPGPWGQKGMIKSRPARETKPVRLYKPDLSIPLQRHSIERCHLTTARDTIDGGTTRRKLSKCGRYPRKSEVLAQVGRGFLGTIPEGGGVHLGAEEERCRGRRNGCRGRRGSGGSGPRGVPRGARMQSGFAQRRGRGPPTNLNPLTGPGSTLSKFSTFSSQSKRDWKKT